MSEYQVVEFGLAAFAVSLAVSFLIVVSQKWHGKLTHDHDLGGVQKVHAVAVPRIGGVAVFAGVLLGYVLFEVVFPGMLKPSRGTRILLLIGAGLPAFLAGFIEDLTKRVSVRIRLAATAFSAIAASLLLGATVNELDIWGVDALLTVAPIAIIITALVVAGGSNAINIIDGFNGLSGSTIVIMAGGLMAVALQHGDTFVAILGALGIGSALGFLALNYPRGRLFLGDGGAYFLGFWVSEMAVLLLVRQPAVSAWQILAICAYPVIEVLFSIYRRKVIKNVSPGAPDALHLHTLVFRRVVCQRVRKDAARPWLRNAGVAPIIAPAVCAGVAASAAFGGTMIGAMLIVLAQVGLYIAVYGRLVRGRWMREQPGIATALPAGIEKP